MVDSTKQILCVEICQSPLDAIEKGYVWRSPKTKPIEVVKVIVVRKGTQEGNATVDFLLEDETGQQFVFMLTGNLVKSIPC